MDLSLSGLSWGAVIAAVAAGQVISTLWFVVFFGEPWAREYGAASKQQHTKEIPGYTYGVQVLCTIAMVLTLAILKRSLAVDGVGGTVQLGFLLSVGLCLATGIPGQAFLRRWRVVAIALGCQVVMIVAASVILGVMA